MNGSRIIGTLLAGAVLLGTLPLACSDPSGRPGADAARAPETPPAEPRGTAQVDSVADRLVARVDSAFREVDLLADGEKRRLRRYLNDEHLALARRLGIDPVRDRRAAAALMSRPPAESGVVHLQTGDFYVVDPRMGYAVPLLVPAAAHLLERIGRRFHHDLEARGLPPYRFILTNVLRTGIDQAHLRGSNVNAARGQSTHEYGTTFDVYYGRFHYAAARDALARRTARGAGVDEAQLRRHLRRPYRDFGRAFAPRLQAVLGRTLLRMQQEGLLAATYERRQPVFHLTVAREVTAPPGPADGAPEAAAQRRFYANLESQLDDVRVDIRDLEEEAGGETRARLSALEEARDSLLEALEQVDARSPEAFRAVKPDLRRAMAELEGRLLRAHLDVLPRRRDARDHLQSRLRRAERTLDQLEGLVEHAAPDVAARHRAQVAHLRDRKAELPALLRRMEETSGAAYRQARSAAATAAAAFTADLEVAAADVTEATRPVTPPASSRRR